MSERTRTKHQELLFPELAGDAGAPRRGRPELETTTVDIGSGLTAPELVADEEAVRRATGEFLGNQTSRHTRGAYGRAIRDLGAFLAHYAPEVESVSGVTTPHLVAWMNWMAADPDLLEGLGVDPDAIREIEPLAVRTRQQKLSGVREWLGHLVRGGVLSTNPAEPVKAPRLRQRGTGATPYLSKDACRELLSSIARDTSLKGTRDLALVSVSVTTLLRADAVLAARVGDLHRLGERTALRATDKGGKEGLVELVGETASYVEAWLEASELAERPEADLWPSFAGAGERLRDRRMSRSGYLKMLKARAADAGIDPEALTVHALRKTGAIDYLKHGGDVRSLQRMMGHAHLSTTATYLDELEQPGREEYGKIRAGVLDEETDDEDLPEKTTEPPPG